LAVLGEWDARAVWATDGACNGASWLAGRGDVARGPTAGMLRDARHLRALPETSEALASGTLAPATARLIARARNERTAAALARDEKLLVEAVAGLGVEEAAQVLRSWARSVDTDGPDPRDRDANGVWLSQGLEGRWRLSGDLDTESGTLIADWLAAEVERLRRQRRATTGPGRGRCCGCSGARTTCAAARGRASWPGAERCRPPWPSAWPATRMSSRW
jgi:hypothetical protein